MNKRNFMFAGIGILLLAVVGFVYLRQQPSQTKTTVPQATTEPVTSDNAATAAGSYVEYSAEEVSKAKGTRVLFFYAPWCPQCRALDASIKAGKVPDDVTIFKVDYDSNQALRQKYGVTIQTTLVKIDGDQALVKKYVAYDEPSLASLKQNLLP